MNYKLQVHFLNDVTTWRAHIPALITMDIIKSHFLHQCRLHSNGYGFKIVQKSFIQSSSNLQEANHLGFSCQHLSPEREESRSTLIPGRLGEKREPTPKHEPSNSRLGEMVSFGRKL